MYNEAFRGQAFRRGATMATASPPRPELLAPAGDWDALRAAVANGADAVYFGLPRFNARHRATNFAPDELPRVIAFLHARNVRGYIAFNTLIFADELPAAVECLKAIAVAGAPSAIGRTCSVSRSWPRTTWSSRWRRREWSASRSRAG